ncbi:MAG: 2OG-Fe(II) oxygenase [Candidatus Marinimicrobia bacterium]|nr:2OG-Fe(II) oxygenase [Candidatus Neomarinimicrobiota bacterium]
MKSSPAQYINLDSFPLIPRGTSAWQSLVDTHKSELEARGASIMKGVIKQDILKRMTAEADAVVPDSFACRDSHTPFLDKDDITLSENHPRRQKQATSLNSIPYDIISPSHALHQLYNWEPLKDFLSAVLGHKLYKMADSMAALTINVMNEDQNHGWHYDESQVTITLMVQKPESGGTFECVPNLRNEDDNQYSKLGAILDGDQNGILSLSVEPGDILIFAGYYSLHRVTPVEGNKTRYVATLCFKDRPGVMNSPEVQQIFYGRVNQR